MIEFAENGGVILFSVLVVPRSSKTEIVGEHGGALKIRLKSPPVDGAANDELIRFLSKFFSIPRSNIEIVFGAASRSKRIRVSGVTSAQINAILQAKI